MPYAEDLALSRAHSGQIAAVLGAALWRDATAAEDRLANTDAVLRGARVSCRVRRAWALGRYAGEFTVRDGRDSGAATEADKLPLADVMLYAFEHPLGHGLARWAVLDLAELRPLIAAGLRGVRKSVPGATFTAYRFADCPSAVIDASWLRASALARRWRAAGFRLRAEGDVVAAEPPLSPAQACEAFPLSWELCRLVGGV